MKSTKKPGMKLSDNTPIQGRMRGDFSNIWKLSLFTGSLL